jgi:hypothetical protein
VHEGGLLSGDRLEITVDGIRGEITFTESPREDWKSPGWTRVRFDSPSANRLRVLPHGGPDMLLRRFLGAKEIRFDDPAFAERFWVESSDAAWARSVLDPEVRRAFIKLQWSPQGPFADRLMLDVGPAGVSLRLSRVLVDNPDLLGWIVDVAVTILRKATAQAGAAGVHLEPVVLHPGSTCPVCGQGLEAAISCPGCGTPHHAECWDYLGGCAIFGCGTRPLEGPRDHGFPVMRN